jgi:hypothetical protein
MSTWFKATFVLTLSMAATAHAQQPVLQRGYDANVSGANLYETTLNASNVGVNTFGLLFKLPVDDFVFAQPLYVPNLTIPNYGVANVVFVVTMSDTVFAFDADVGGAPIWSVNLAGLFDTTAPLWANFAIPPSTPTGNLGIMSTPVIDLTTNLMYVVGCTLENSTIAYRLHAIDITSGGEPLGPGVLITGTDGVSTFDAPFQLQRTSLVLSGNQVVFAFAAMHSEYPSNYLGWVVAYNKQTLQQSAIFAPVVGGTLQGGVWQSGRPPAVDSDGYIYLFTGNTQKGGDGYNGINDFSESALKLDPANGLAIVDWFTPGNWSYLDAHDLDLSGSGPTLIPGTSLLVGGGKSGKLYVLNTANLGHWNATDSQVVQSEDITDGNELLAGYVYWEGSATTLYPMLYDWGASDVLRAYQFNPAAPAPLAATPIAKTTYKAKYPGASLALSANGSTSGSAVLWANTPANSAAVPPLPAVLHAFDAENIPKELWNSNMNPTRDGYGLYASFVPPLVANGKVYVATHSNQVAVYGLLSATVSPSSLAFGVETTHVASAAQAVTVTNVGAATLPITITLSGAQPHQFSQTNTCGTSLAGGANCVINVVFVPTAIGKIRASLNVNAGPTVAVQTVALSGSGVAGSFTVSPSSLAFGNETINVASAAQSVTVTNTGAAALPLKIALGGKQFSQTNTCGTSLAGGANCVINVVFDPPATGVKSASLSINSGTAAGTQNVPLGGTGVKQ